jgi:glyceraldehyde-3-phosphate dehydrogenase (NADP+)
MNGQMLLDGDWVDRDETTPVTDPGNSETVGLVPLAAVEDVELAVNGAQRALSSPLPGHERARVLAEAARLLEERAEEAAVLIATEGIKTIREARSEANRAVATMRLSAEEAKRLTGDTLSMDQYPSGVALMGFTVREPLGVIGAITPFNDPLNLVAHKIGPALASGNAVVLKPDSKTPLSALLLARCLHEAGLPAGRLQVLTGPGSVIGDAIVTHPLVRMISFTGGVDAGRAIHARAGLKRVSMELGANNPVIVHRDADLELAAEKVGSGAFWAAGQNCLHVQRIYAHDDVFDDLTNRLVKYAESTVLGPKLSEDTDMGPLIDRQALSRTEAIVRDAVDSGAEILTGGDVVGTSFQPTLLVDAARDSRAMTEEVYAPVTVVAPYSEMDDALEMANDTDYELAAAVFSQSIDVAFAAARRLQVGQVMVNESTDFRIDAMPFGGGGASGLGREGVAYAVRAMTDPKVIAFSGVEVPGLG